MGDLTVVADFGRALLTALFVVVLAHAFMIVKLHWRVERVAPDAMRAQWQDLLWVLIPVCMAAAAACVHSWVRWGHQPADGWLFFNLVEMAGFSVALRAMFRFLRLQLGSDVRRRQRGG